MPTLNKLEYLDKTKELIKNALNTKFNSGITDEDTFRSYVGKIQNIYTNWPKVTDKGTELSINAKKGKMELEPYGNTEQNSYTGNQLVDFSNLISAASNTTSSFVNNILSVSSSSGTYTNAFYDITNLFKNNPGKTIKFVYESIDVSNQYGSPVGLYVSYTDDTPFSTPTLLNHLLNSTPYTISNDTSNINYVRFRILPNGSSTNQSASITITKPMLQFGTETKTYEPFVEGSPSPSSDYPQPIKVVTGNNTIIVKHKIL